MAAPRSPTAGQKVKIKAIEEVLPSAELLAHYKARIGAWTCTRVPLCNALPELHMWDSNSGVLCYERKPVQPCTHMQAVCCYCLLQAPDKGEFLLLSLQTSLNRSGRSCCTLLTDVQCTRMRRIGWSGRTASAQMK